MSENRRTAPAPEAASHRSWWPGWIWAVPIAAVGIGAWLLVRFLTQGGTDITITFPKAEGIDPSGTSIVYHVLKVGSVNSLSLAANNKDIVVHATIQDRATKFLHRGTVFWLRGTHPSLSDLSSLGSILSGPTIVMEPGPGEKETHFSGRGRQPIVPRDHSSPVIFNVSFHDAVGELSPGDPVKLRGFTVGEVKQVGFHYDAQSGELETPVQVALYPSLLHIENATQPNDRAALLAALSRLVGEGLRASRDPPLIGSYRVGLEMVPGAPDASLDTAAKWPELPIAPGGGLRSVMSRVNKIPLDQIGQNLLDISKHIDQLAASPQLQKSIADLQASLSQIHQLVKTAAPEVDAAIKQLRETSAQLERTAHSASQTMGGATSQNGLDDTLREMKNAARAVRSLADYLERHPEALISGKGGR